MEMLQLVKKAPWQLQYQDRHLIKRSTKFFNKAPMATIKMWRKLLKVSTINKDERKKVIGGDINTFTKKRDKQKISRIYSIPCKKRKGTNQQMGQTDLKIAQQALPIKNKMIARTYSRGRNEKKYLQMHMIKGLKKMEVAPPVQLTPLDPSFTCITNNRMMQT